MKKYYLLEDKGVYVPGKTYSINIKDSVFLKNFNKVKFDKLEIFITSDRNQIEDFDDKDISKENIYDKNGFNKLFGFYGELKIDEKTKSYYFSCKGIAEIINILYVENNDINVHIVEMQMHNKNFNQQKIFTKIKGLLDEYIRLENININLESKNDLNSFINYNLEILFLNPLVIKKILYFSDLKEKAEYTIMTLETLINMKKYGEKIRNKVKINLDNQQKEYFLREEIKVIQEELDEINPETSEIKKLENIIKKIKISDDDKKIVFNEIKRLQSTPVMSPEYSIIRTYLETIIALPWEKETTDDVSFDIFEKNFRKTHYGLEDVKERIIEFLAVKKLNPAIKSPIICLVGPPGVGKSSLAKSIATSINRKFIRISLGGVKDESEIRGHRRTYVGAMPGKFIQSLKKVKVKNPLILLDEIDKMESGYRGDPASAMLEITDPEQNKEFVDHYLDIPFDLSKILFIATANNLADIPAPLRDRMEIIRLSSYTIKEKENIAKEYLIKKQIEENGLNKEQISFTSNAILKIITGYTYEAGVRDLERKIATICRKVAIKILKGEKKIKVTLSNITELLGNSKFDLKTKNKKSQIGVVNGLAYTSLGGDILEIETVISAGSGKLILTGKLGDVMKESAQASLSYIRSNSKILKVDNYDFNKIDIHLHVPEGAIPKDGPSAGITILISILSTLKNKAVDSNIAMTGEITLHGKIIPIGGVKEKLYSAEKMGIKEVILPYKNKIDINEISKDVLKNLKLDFVSDVKEVLNIIFKE
ncbi:endopeptidase La [Gemelliphila asaccharolytica]|uniref:endopeptidase La n=1 Tax=Gemelliphila asaccharolytica TaxID=502393 RepID=A0ABR5TLY2_9BACL|nr:endopeptidase La [Gemella asaccharolytica]KXB58035.1 endopeptidase La [Gemella asaccharolytica]